MIAGHILLTTRSRMPAPHRPRNGPELPTRDIARDELLGKRGFKRIDGRPPAAQLERHDGGSALLAQRAERFLPQGAGEVDASFPSDRRVPTARRRALPPPHLAVRLLHLQHAGLCGGGALLVADEAVRVQLHHQLAVRLLHLRRARAGVDAQDLRRLGPSLPPAEEPFVHVRVEGVEALVRVLDGRAVQLAQPRVRLAARLEHHLRIAAQRCGDKRLRLEVGAALHGEDGGGHPVGELPRAGGADRDRVLRQRRRRRLRRRLALRLRRRSVRRTRGSLQRLVERHRLPEQVGGGGGRRRRRLGAEPTRRTRRRAAPSRGFLHGHPHGEVAGRRARRGGEEGGDRPVEE
mmetsp:Transcript_29581/g.61946  ORF Transcript_29581/g.61946 Transcript_29581/m.61946 type:complete len:349 (-) Transcript_29581:128-1174(-)